MIEHMFAIRELCPKGETLEHRYPDCFKAHLTDTSCNEYAAWDHLGWQVPNRLVCGETSRTCPFPVQNRRRLRRTSA